jgi:DNA-binding response OmpR family regulator
VSKAPDTVLVIEPLEETRVLIAGILSDAGFAVRTGTNAADAKVAIDRRVDAVLLALNLPDADGLDVLRELRPRTDAAILVVTARTNEVERIAGLDAGADDYITKPFGAGELVARVRAHVRGRTRVGGAERIEFPGLVVDAGRREVLMRGRVVDLRQREFDLLYFLASSPGQVFTRGQLLEHVWHSSTEWQRTATVTEHVRRVREQIELDPESPLWVQTVRGVGYKFVRPARET